MNSKKEDIMCMKRALYLAEKGRGFTSPNPMVGALVVKDGIVIGEGFHKKAGTPHAEVIAIENAHHKTVGATLYVNLEPCCHKNKRTPPCTEAIIKAGIKRVVVAMEDPNPEVSGRGIEFLKKHGVEVECGVLGEEAKKLNEVFIKYITTKTPFVIMKIAQSIDGKIATSSYESKWITGEKARMYVQELRHMYDAVLVGIGTLLFDDPSLTARIKGGINPYRIILDSTLRIPLSSKVIRENVDSKTIIATTEQRANREKLSILKDMGIKILILPCDNRGFVDIRELLRVLGRLEISSVLVEGGSNINASFLRAGVVDKVIFFIAPMIIGGSDAISSIGGLSPETLDSAIKIKRMRVDMVGNDILIEGYIDGETKEDTK
ncbi:MAG: bifunctional diaminohydroxyphosphoribosylaminopyrimidine deaminase/5-amino-6-(5-phosphoribosylamino)uracil reductase RibD [Nitrospirae bacterium]|nr:MAG: bifunctional diaminohydroxyphosphoribosylaminopyrimidine deaminase/5-amino-6-(5-phosphoribosylamino)uracil reductase RibD [Nitrospirota bacterium]